MFEKLAGAYKILAESEAEYDVEMLILLVFLRLRKGTERTLYPMAYARAV